LRGKSYNPGKYQRNQKVGRFYPDTVELIKGKLLILGEKKTLMNSMAQWLNGQVSALYPAAPPPFGF
jgi:hypothetical protein